MLLVRSTVDCERIELFIVSCTCVHDVFMFVKIEKCYSQEKNKTKMCNIKICKGGGGGGV